MNSLRRAAAAGAIQLLLFASSVAGGAAAGVQGQYMGDAGYTLTNEDGNTAASARGEDQPNIADVANNRVISVESLQEEADEAKHAERFPAGVTVASASPTQLQRRLVALEAGIDGGPDGAHSYEYKQIRRRMQADEIQFIDVCTADEYSKADVRAKLCPSTFLISTLAFNPHGPGVTSRITLVMRPSVQVTSDANLESVVRLRFPGKL